MSIHSEIQSSRPSALIELFRLDCSIIGGPVLHFVQSRDQADRVSFGDILYEPHDVKVEGMIKTGTGSLPTPTVTLSNTNGIFQALINTYGDLNGCLFVRLRTFERYLDGHADADPNAVFGPDIFRIEQKISETPTEIVWQLSADIDQAGKQIPARAAIRDTCTFAYRVWRGSAFDYSGAICPYAGGAFFDINDNPVANPAQDVPSRRLSCCKARFGADVPLPFGGFPGMSRSAS